eukprot:Gb_24034 [translate_table: standard]
MHLLGHPFIGAILTTCKPLNTEGEMSRQIRESNPCLIFTLPQYIHKVSATQLPIILVQGTKQEGGQSCVSTLRQLLQSDVNSLPSVKIRQHDTATLLYSSGTTGRNKGVISTHRNYIAMTDIEAGTICRVRVIFLFVQCPCSMSMAFFIWPLRLLLVRPSFIMPKCDSEEMLSAVQKYRVTHLFVFSPILIALAKSEIANKDDLSSLQQICLGGAPLKKMSYRSSVYGLTESSGAIAFTKTNEGIRNYCTAGSLSANVEE